MYGFKNLSILATFGAMLALTSAVPTGDVEAPANVKRNQVIFNMYAGDECNDNNKNYSFLSGSNCVQVPFGVRSIYQSGRCTITTWSGTNCEGTSQVIPSGQCTDILYGSVSYQC